MIRSRISLAEPTLSVLDRESVRIDPGRILVATSDPRESRRINSALASGTWATTVASGGEEALREASSTAAGSPDVIILGLPLSGPYGRLVIETVRSSPPAGRSAILAVVGAGPPDELSSALDAGADQAVTRPFDAADLLSRARILIELRQLRIAVEATREMARAATSSLATVRSERSSFTSRLSHDLKSPLTGIMGHAQMLQLKCASANPEIDGYATRILGAAHQIQKMLSDLRDLGLLEDGRFRMSMEPLDLHSVLSIVMEEQTPVADASGVDLELVPSRPRKARDVLMVEGDAGLLIRLIGNLVSNAIRHSPPEGRVRVLIGSQGEDNAEIHISDVADEVHDYAAGLFRNAGALHREPGAEDRLAGGVQMAFCRAAVASHGGRIWVKPNAAGGSTIGLLLPAVKSCAR
jgi:signal transduction histidine kinase